MAVQLGEQARVDRAARGAVAVAVEGFAARATPTRATVSSGMLPGAVVERDQLVQARRHQRDVGDAADVLHGAPPPGRPEQQVIDQRHQRRALAAGGDVAHAEVADHRSAGALGDHGGLADLQRRAQAARRARAVHGGLAVRADEVHFLDRDARRRAHGKRRVGERLAEQDVELAQLGRVGLAPGRRCVRAAVAGTAW